MDLRGGLAPRSAVLEVTFQSESTIKIPSAILSKMILV